MCAARGEHAFGSACSNFGTRWQAEVGRRRGREAIAGRCSGPLGLGDRLQWGRDRKAAEMNALTTEQNMDAKPGRLETESLAPKQDCSLGLLDERAHWQTKHQPVTGLGALGIGSMQTTPQPAEHGRRRLPSASWSFEQIGQHVARPARPDLRAWNQAIGASEVHHPCPSPPATLPRASAATQVITPIYL